MEQEAKLSRRDFFLKGFTKTARFSVGIPLTFIAIRDYYDTLQFPYHISELRAALLRTGFNILEAGVGVSILVPNRAHRRELFKTMSGLGALAFFAAKYHDAINHYSRIGRQH
jgi:hypothetical protein